MSFVSVAELSSYTGRSFAGDAGGTLVVDMATATVQTLTEQTLTRGTTTGTFDGTGTDALLLTEGPVNTIGSVSVSDNATPPAWTVAGTADYALDSKGVLLATNTAGTSLFGGEWPMGRQNIAVTYDHGYTTIPDDLKMVTMMIASRLIIQGVAQFESLGDLNIRYGVNSSDLTAGEMAILRKYKRAQ